MTFGEKLQTLRRDAALSQEALAEAIGVSRQTVSKWENDAALPETDKIVLLSRLFGVSTDALLLPAEAGAEPASTEPEPEAAAHSPAPQKRSAAPGNKVRRIALVSVPLILVGIVAGLVLIFGKTSAERAAAKRCPYVLVHGLGGWGDGSGMNGVSRYWGADACDLAAELRNRGYEVYTPSVGPVSSAWDRACELYAILTGTTVDYGAAHAAAHSHARFGRTYETPLLPQWDNRHKVNLVGHSFGGETVRLLASLLAYGDEAEQAASPEDLSPLFRGGQEKLVHSVTTLCSPHNGSSLTCVLETLGGLVGLNNTTEMLATLCFATAGAANPLNGVYDFMLDQFGVTNISGGYPEICAALSAVTESNNDHAGYDLSPDGAKALNETIRLCDSVYYFSYSYCTTKPGNLLNVQTPLSSTLPVLYPFAAAMGSYNGHTAGGIAIDESWQPNDGLVSVVSAQYPAQDPHAALTAEAAPQKGVWNVAPTLEGHHGTVIGLSAPADSTIAFYTELFAMIDGLK